MTKNIIDSRKDTHFLFVGGGSNLDKFKEAFSKSDYLKYVSLPGTVPYSDVPKFLSVMDIVIAPYPKLEFWYPSSMKIFEYMSAGKAVVASAVGQINDIIQQKENGILFDPDEKNDMEKSVNLLLDNENLRKNLSINARSTILEKYTWKYHAQKMIDIFQEVIDRKRNN